ncbi:late competence development ComFB family protein [Neomoorella thermoacetica]|uniref:ComF operon protein 2 n=2 Tax=Neomoorella thermoacetica TaxID=1525 RepID=A0A1D7X6M8_NEOTH|nr:late competence development ComFB family protein [Moorella thermoacetica]AKX92900.1 late competence development protein ComFB [Moorella thermoacetica]AKX95453.1 late competence development protein ComFB [Moorella thermoacetica]AOQ22570.1 Late competence development protein ComFB [Moorella thermoacetica]OIQ10256.1 late competence development protein ComFB [Moorella thermoacetica]OIQ11937.1 late competence development protein ComFB [Moorella thermoacetica]
MARELFLKNYMEDCVWELLDQVLKRDPEACRCDTCRHDIVALALNQLPPRYVVREQGAIYSKIAMLEAQHRADIYSALTRALMIVKKAPRHGQEDRS